MSAVPAPIAPASTPDWASRLKVTQARVVLSEWTKLRSLRSTRWSMFAAALLTIVLPVLISLVVSTHWSHMSPGDRARRNPLRVALFGVNISQLAIGVLGVVAITGEYSTGMIRATIGAVPKRLPVLWAKVIVFGVVSLAIAVPSVFLGFFGSQAIFRSHHILHLTLSDPGVTRTVIGGALYLTVIAVFALALGAIIRNTAGALAVFAAIIFVIPPLMNVLPQSWNDAASKYLPSNAGGEIFAIAHGPHDFGPWSGFAIFCGYAALAVAIAAVLLVRRDT